MLKKIEALFLGGRWRRDEHAWGVWRGIEPLIPTRFPGVWEKMPMAGRVVRVYQHAHRGTKALVYFGSALGTQDTWWPYKQPRVDTWVIVEAHLWLPPGTHSEEQVLWIAKWESWAPGDTQIRAQRHLRKLEKEAGRLGGAAIGEGAQSQVSDRPAEAGNFPTQANSIPPSAGMQEQPEAIERESFAQLGVAAKPPADALFQTTGIAVDAGVDQVMSTASDIAAGMEARTYGPVEIGGGRLLSIWPVVGEPTFASVTARPMLGGAAWVGVSSQSLHIEALDIMDDIAGALKSRLGELESGLSPPERAREYDRGATRKLECEIQDLLKEMAADPSAWGYLSGAVYEREVLLQDLTELGA